MPLSAMALALAASGCAAPGRSSYVRPEVGTAEHWDQAAAGATVRAGSAWWNAFDDARLVALVDRVLAANPDLAAAGLRLKQGRLAARLARQDLLPGGTANLSSGANKALDGGGTWNDSSSGSAAVSWEVDLFGRLDARADAATWGARATAQDLAGTRLALVGTTVSTWWQLALANEQISLGEASLDYVRKALDLVQRQYRAGAVSQLQVREAEQSLAVQEAAQTQLVQRRVEARKTLAALLARQSYDGPEPEALPTGELPAIPAGVPAQLLARRPDLAAAELRLRAALATSDATVASYYPRLSLTAALGGSSSGLLGFLSNPVASLGAMLSLPELSPAKIRLGSEQARTTYRIAAEDFRTTFYNALRDTQIALSAREQLIRQATALRASLAAASDAERLYQRQYRAGAINLRIWLDAQERLRTARANLLQNRYSALVSQVQVYQALGGDAAEG